MSASFEFYKLNQNMEKELQESYKKDIEWQKLIEHGDYTRANELEFSLIVFLHKNCEIIEFSTSYTSANEIQDKLSTIDYIKLEDTYCFFRINNAIANCIVMKNTEIYLEKWKDYFDGDSILLYKVSK